MSRGLDPGSRYGGHLGPGGGRQATMAVTWAPRAVGDTRALQAKPGAVRPELGSTVLGRWRPPTARVAEARVTASASPF